ncbi:MAG: hypothetical protein UV74_C0013G0559 [Candidatus Woesebacteria bacterium GW2011_GWB1_43_14]|uniref:Uncharacterized protein n=1 Tax=Candidatus Woesebacteria bacterium GW2011_GWB1_43_14 TaxID=1618578 RepID=A0A0G1DIL5_9BACT|nr:MAG: hypothetical protein UT21_C0001G0272 [Candidatus Woesebacteria bacterium GW2011_GWA1_39_11b]KKS77984.1 MAG: hypothetical protein UV51_C0003G0019 [Candidatus Woesebacteria bacterium GW2011_GWC1_42_9]KKS97437.1 MAG: hypothetical protein UV74_C0013G0559 [Candidatus Woesebacteria bacterium GW2011_GWB1_43_14]
MKSKRPFVVNLIILSAITVVIWISFETYRVFTKEPPFPVPEEILEKDESQRFTFKLDPEVLGGLQNRIYLNEIEIGDTTIKPAELPPVEEIAEEVPIATEEATPSASEASPAGSQI